MAHLMLAQAGAAVVVQARRTEKLHQLAAEITGSGGKALAVAGDAAFIADIDALSAQNLTWNKNGGKYDIVEVNAGRGVADGILDSDAAQWQELCQITVLGAAHLMRRAGQCFVQRQSGDIVVLSFVVAKNISPFNGFYGSSKFAVSAIAEGLRREVCSHGVRVSTVMPGIVTSGFQAVAGYDEEQFGKAVAPFGRLLEPNDIAQGIVWLLSLPAHVHVNEIMIRPTGQTYP